MRKFSALTIMAAVLFVFMSVSAYACGDKNSSAKSAKVDASKAQSEAVQVSANTGDAKVMTTEAKVTQGNSGCCSSQRVKVTTAEAKVKTADAKYCPASSVCPASACPAGSKAKAMDAKARTVDSGQSKSGEAVAMAPTVEETAK